MADEVVVRFLEATSQDESLRAGLSGILGVEDGGVYIFYTPILCSYDRQVSFLPTQKAEDSVKDWKTGY